MAGAPNIVITARDVELAPDAREKIERRCRGVAEEFPETTHFEITLSQDGSDFVGHAHVTGKGTEVASEAGSEDVSVAAERLIATVEKQLRKIHDKRIFKNRREAQRRPPKKG